MKGHLKAGKMRARMRTRFQRELGSEVLHRQVGPQGVAGQVGNVLHMGHCSLEIRVDKGCNAIPWTYT